MCLRIWTSGWQVQRIKHHRRKVWPSAVGARVECIIIIICIPLSVRERTTYFSISVASAWCFCIILWSLSVILWTSCHPAFHFDFILFLALRIYTQPPESNNNSINDYHYCYYYKADLRFLWTAVNVCRSLHWMNIPKAVGLAVYSAERPALHSLGHHQLLETLIRYVEIVVVIMSYGSSLLVLPSCGRVGFV